MEYGFFPPCPFYKLTGLQCPGCGSQRAIHSLLNGNITQAFGYNPLMVLSIPYLLGGYILRVFAKQDDRIHALYLRLYHGKAVFAVLIVVLVFAVGRNMI
ncbi:MAG: DUF2752 domain-containing protein [Marinifilaceae bacterium]